MAHFICIHYAYVTLTFDLLSPKLGDMTPGA